MDNEEFIWVKNMPTAFKEAPTMEGLKETKTFGNKAGELINRSEEVLGAKESSEMLEVMNKELSEMEFEKGASGAVEAVSGLLDRFETYLDFIEGKKDEERKEVMKDLVFAKRSGISLEEYKSSDPTAFRSLREGYDNCSVEGMTPKIYNKTLNNYMKNATGKVFNIEQATEIINRAGSTVDEVVSHLTNDDWLNGKYGFDYDMMQQAAAVGNSLKQVAGS